MTADEAIAHLQISRRTLNKWMAEDALPHHRVGQVLRFDQDEVDAWLRNRCSVRAAGGAA